MLKLMMGMAFMAFFAACGPAVPPSKPNDTPAVDSLQTVNNPANNINVQTYNMTEIDSSGVLILPLSMGETDRESKGSFYKSMPKSNCWNIVFYNSKTGDAHLLSEKKMLITGYQNKYNGSGGIEIGQSAKYIFYTIIADDYNKDGKLNEGDPAYLFATNKVGDSLQQLSPSGCQLKNWQYLQSSNKLLMTVQKDSDNNNQFDELDEVLVFTFEMGKSAAPAEILSQSFKNKLKLLYNKQWQKPAQ